MKFLLDNSFLAANSLKGFYSVFEKCYNYFDGYKVYIIKGGPGSGKSSFMKKTALAAECRGYIVERCYCSSDPSSLDGVILHDKKMIILDGTAPHNLEARFPGACEEILNFGAFWNSEMLFENRKDIIEASLKNKRLHEISAKYLKAAGNVLTDSFKTVLSLTDTEKCIAFAENISKQYFKPKPKTGNESIRFITGITPKGIVSFTDTIEKQYKETVIIKDSLGTASSIILAKIRNRAIKNGYDIISVKSPFFPEEIYEHILVPELNVAFLTENEYNHFNIEKRRIHSSRFINTQRLKLSANRLKFNKKITENLLETAVLTLKKAKEAHDELEDFYIKSMNFEALDFYTKSFIENTL